MTISVFIATSIDGYIADQDDGLEWLDTVPTSDGEDHGYADFISRIDAIVMGRGTYEVVSGFDMDWPYQVPVIVLSHSLTSLLPQHAELDIHLFAGAPVEVSAYANSLGYSRLYIDGGKTIQGFLNADLVDEMIITEIPLLLGGGHPLFGQLNDLLSFSLVSAATLSGPIVQKHYRRTRRGH